VITHALAWPLCHLVGDLKILESVLDYTPSPLPLPEPTDEPTPEKSAATDETASSAAQAEQRVDETKDLETEELEQAEEAESRVVKSEDTEMEGATTTKEEQPEKGDLADDEEEKKESTEPVLPDTTILPPPSESASSTPRSRPTLVIATGDANSSEYNPGGFLGCVRRALDRGWDVEIASFSTHGLSSLWHGEKAKRVTEDGKARGELRIVNLENFAEELLL